MKYWNLLLISLLYPLNAQAATPRIVTTIQPLQTIVSQITHGITTTDLLISSNQSAHHYQLKPSDRRKLQTADVIFWIGDELETFFPAIIKSLPKEITIVDVISAPNLVLLKPRNAGHAEHAHLDPHIWLDSQNGIEIARLVTQTLSNLDPVHQQGYQQNLKQLVSQVKTYQQNKMTGYDIKYLVYHDAYQYFEYEFKLKPLAVISNDENRAPGARHLSALNQLMQHQKVDCIFYTSAIFPDAINVLTKTQKVKTIWLDPVTSGQKNKNIQYSNLLNTFLHKFVECAGSESDKEN